MSLRAPGRDPPRPLIPEARAEAEGLLRVQGQPVLAGREPGLPGLLRRHGDRETLGREIWRGKLKKVDILEMPTLGRGIWQEN